LGIEGRDRDGSDHDGMAITAGEREDDAAVGRLEPPFTSLNLRVIPLPV
jgi:hypothetical protein